MSSVMSPLKLPEPTEKQIQHEGCRLLRTFGFAVYNLSQSRASKQTPGLADTFIVGHGITAWCEWKTRKGKQSFHQAKFQFDVEANGGRYYLFRSATEVVEWYEHLMSPEAA